MKKTLIAALALVAMVGCNKTLIESPISESEYGYINLGIAADSEIVETRTETEVTGDERNSYNIYLYKVDSNIKTIVEGYPKEFSSLENSIIKLPQGQYIVAAENLNIQESENGNAMRLYGESAQAVASGTTYKVSVICKVANAKVSVVMDSAFDNNSLFPSPTVTITEINEDNNNSSNVPRTITITQVGAEHSDNTANFFTADDTVTGENNTVKNVASLKYTLTTKDSSDNTKSWSGNISALPAQWTKITLKPGANGKVNVSIRKDEDLTVLEPQEVTLDPTDGK